MRTAFVLLFLTVSTSILQAAGLQTFYWSMPHPICGLKPYQYHVGFPLQNDFNNLQYLAISQPLACRHLMFGFNPVTAAQIPADAALAREVIQEAQARHALTMDPPVELTPAPCADVKPPNAPPPDCIAAISNAGRSSLMTLERFRALEVLDNYFGQVDYASPAERTRMQVALFGLKAAAQNITARDVVKALQLNTEMTKSVPAARIEAVPAAPFSADIDITTIVKTHPIFVRLIDATARITVNFGLGRAFVQFLSGQVTMNSQMGRDDTLNMLSVNWCKRVNATFTMVGAYIPILNGLKDPINKNASLSFEGKVADIALPAGDSSLKAAWLCLATFGSDPGPQGPINGLTFGHASDAKDKGCPNCF